MSPKRSATIDGHTATTRSGTHLVAAIVVTACWLVALLALAVMTANPVTVNRSQLLAADAVVVARADLASVSGNSVSINVEQALAGRELPKSLRIFDAETDRFGSGLRYLIPLQKTTAGYAVAPVPKLKLEASPHGPVLVPYEDGEDRTAVFYPATDDVLKTAKRILTTEASRPYP